MIDGTYFIKQESESNPFIKKYYLPQCALVGPYYACSRMQNKSGNFTWRLFDWTNYEEKNISDEEFINLHSNKNKSQLAPTNIPCNNDVEAIEIIGNMIFPVPRVVVSDT